MQAPVPRVVSLQQYRNADVISTLKTLLRQAERGDLRGILFAVHYTGPRHEMGMVGDYATDLTQAAGACSRLWHQITDLQEDRSR